MTNLAVRRRAVVKRLKLREKAHAKIDEAFDLYEEGAPLHIVCQMSWTSQPERVKDRLQVTISPSYQ